MTESPTPRDLLAFTPVPGARARHDGWLPERQRGFIDALARLGLVNAAARSVGMSAKSAYALRKRAGEDSSFARAWDAAVGEGRAQALDTGIERAIHGERIPVFYRGREVGHRIRYDSRLLIAAMRAVRPSARRAGKPEPERPS